MLFISDGSQGSHKHCLQVKFHIMPYNLQEDKHFPDKCGFLLKKIYPYFHSNKNKRTTKVGQKYSTFYFSSQDNGQKEIIIIFFSLTSYHIVLKSTTSSFRVRTESNYNIFWGRKIIFRLLYNSTFTKVRVTLLQNKTH